MDNKYEKLSDYAKRLSISYQTAWNHYNKGIIPNTKMINNRVYVLKNTEQNTDNEQKVALYARVSSNENKNNLQKQSERLEEYAIAKGYTITHNIKEIGSGVNDNRKKLTKLLKDDSWNILLVEYKDRLTRFGYNYIQLLTDQQNRKIEIINQAEKQDEDLMQDFINIITSFCSRLYGLRRSQRKTEKLIKELQNNE